MLFRSTNLAPYINSNIFTGFERAYSYSDMMPGLVPLVAILDLIFHSPILTINIIQLVSIMLLPYGIYLLARHIEIQIFPAVLAGLMGGFTNFHIHNFLHFQLQFAFLIPYALLFCIRFLKSLDLKSLLIFNTIWIFSASVSSHIFVYISFSIFILFLIFAYHSIKENSIREILFRLNVLPRLIYLPILLFSLLCIIYIITPYLQNMKDLHFMRMRVESENYSIRLNTLNKVGFDFVSLFAFIFIGFGFRKNFVLLNKKLFYILVGLSILFFLLSLGPKPYHPYLILYYFFPGFSSIRDSSRILYLFWIVFPLLICYTMQNISFMSKLVSGKILHLNNFCFGLIFFALILILIRSPNIHKMEISTRLVEIHDSYSKGNYAEPLLLLSKGKSIADSIKLDSESQYLSIFHGKNLTGGYSGVYPYSLHLLRYALVSFLSDETGWEIEQIQQIVSASRMGSIELLDGNPTWRNKIDGIFRDVIINPCSEQLQGSWRNIEKISERYGLILGHTPNSSFCLNSYSLNSDRKLFMLWKAKNEVVYKDELYITTPFYYHPKAPELLYGLEGYRKKGKYSLELFEGESKLYEGSVSVE